MLKTRRSRDRLIFNMGIPIPGKDGLYIETVPSELNISARPPSSLVCSKTCLVGLLIRSIFRGKNCTSASARMQFFQRKIERIYKQQDMFCLNHASAFYKSNNTVKMLIDNKSKAQTLTGNPTRNNRCQLLVSRVLNMPCRFGHSARSIESRCVVRVINVAIALEMGLVGERVVIQVSVNVWWHNDLAECWLDIQEL